MDFIIADKNKMEECLLSVSRTMDIEIGDTDSNNDFELTLSLLDSQMIDFDKYLFSPGTEYGGIIEDMDASTSSGTVKWYGNTWRGFLDQIIIEPPTGSAYRTVAGDANTVMRNLLSGQLNNMFEVDSSASGITVNYQFARYVSYLEGFTAMLKQYNARLEIWAEQGSSNEAFAIKIKAAPVTDYSEEIEYSQDNKINLSIRDYRRGINHLICLGKGELTERQVIHLYAQSDGSVGTAKYYTGLAERTEVYDYSSADDEETLIEYGTKRLQKLMNYQELSMEVQDLDLAIGDIVAGRERNTGVYLSKPIKQKILKVDGLKETISYKVEGEN